MIEVLDRVDEAGIRVWLEGGWGVDALVGEQTRPHRDVDLAFPAEDEAALLAALSALGFELVEDERPTRFLVRDGRGREIDLHPLTFDANGDGLQAAPGGGYFRWPREGMLGTGTIGGRRVSCITAELQVRFHSGYGADERDLADLKLLHERLGVAIPPRRA